MTFTVIPTITTGDVATAAWGNTYLKDNFDHILTAGGLLRQEVGGLEADISAIAKGGLVSGTGTGTAGLRTVGANERVLAAASGQASGLEWLQKGWRLEGSATGETSHTGDTNSTRMTAISGLSIPANEWVLFMYVFRTSVQNYFGRFGIYMNSTSILSPGASGPRIDTAAAIGSGVLFAVLGPRETNYPAAAVCFWGSTNTTGTRAIVGGLGAAAITNIEAIGQCEHGDLTVYTKNAYVYSHPA